MKGCFYDYIFTLPTNEIKEYKKPMTMKELCEQIQKDLLEHYYIYDITINNQVIYNLQKRPHFCNKILKNRCSVCKHVSAIKTE
tara:strand:+ start:606 stop:857 length:252 start_codon:yes stop_codon:yes gene_type:complete